MAHFLVGLIVLTISLAAGGSIYGMNDFKYDPNFGNQGQGRLPVWKVAVSVLLGVKTFCMLWVLFFLSN